MWIKTAAVAALTAAVGQSIRRTTPPRMLTLLWVVALSLSFVHLAMAGMMGL